VADEDLTQATLYCNAVPCRRCAQLLVQRQVGRLVCGDYMPVTSDHECIDWLRSRGVRVTIQHLDGESKPSP
jgi:deoxycytidylate deaminase